MSYCRLLIHNMLRINPEVTDKLDTKKKIRYKYLPAKFYGDVEFRQYLKKIYENIVPNKS